MSWRSSGLKLRAFFLRFRTEEFWVWSLRYCAWVERDEIWMMIHHLSCVLEDVFVFGLSFDHGCDLEPWTSLLRMFDWYPYQCSNDVSGWDAMSKGGMEIWAPCGSTLWVRVKRHVIHHGCIVVCTEDTCGRLLQEFMTCCTEVMKRSGREHSTCCRRNLVCDLQVGHNILLVFGLIILWHSLRCHWSMLTSECGVLISSTSYSGFCLSLVQLIAWAEDTYIGLTLRFCIVSSTLRSLFSPSDENAARNSWRRV